VEPWGSYNLLFIFRHDTWTLRSESGIHEEEIGISLAQPPQNQFLLNLNFGDSISLFVAHFAKLWADDVAQPARNFNLAILRIKFGTRSCVPEQRNSSTSVVSNSVHELSMTIAENLPVFFPTLALIIQPRRLIPRCPPVAQNHCKHNISSIIHSDTLLTSSASASCNVAEGASVPGKVIRRISR
jgi:hypothetical protein